QLCVHALLVQLHLPELVSTGEIPPPPGAAAPGGGAGQEARPPVWLGKDYQLQRQAGEDQRGHWRALSPLEGPVGIPLEWVEPVVGG
ncbi:MAG: hypothetical protein ACKOPT_06335, partial [Cyanobium sp.]